MKGFSIDDFLFFYLFNKDFIVEKNKKLWNFYYDDYIYFFLNFTNEIYCLSNKSYLFRFINRNKFI